MSILQFELSELEKALIHSDKHASSVSSSNIAWHIDHSLKVIHKVSTVLIDSDPSKYKWKFNKWRFIIFIKGSFPRGKVKAPKHVRPPEIIKLEDIKLQLKEVQKNLTDIEKLPSKSHFDHPIFGQLHLKKTIRFLELHTTHHIKIINDILKAI
ncbi:DUF1569 domain-containing protein [Aureibaculum sp. A20]|uniref:DUF1569 domain-containing protein n=1 Tax=Aureibaculum flavum TaxID=2795986 RepID=A0ABS0WTI5_9FLAO|nr:DUF1569 domain-containing protein [Aureibaculum flavum]MBJ2175307.1 DUF1569 domain-containing protein [Aureibaculum flavum]